MNAKQEFQFDPREFRQALGQFATGVTVVTAADREDGYVGTTASSFNSVSVDPPLILWSIDKASRSRPAYEHAEHFVVNILAADQVTLSNNFARQQDDKFAGVDYSLNEQGVPVLPGCSAYFHCETRYLYEGGDHLIIVGEVQNFHTSHRDGLLFHQGRYSVSDVHPVAAPAPMATEEPEQKSFAENYLHYLSGRCFQQLMGQLDQMLTAQNISQHEYRVLASFSGLEEADLATLSRYTLLESEDLVPVLNGLQQRGLLARVDEGYLLSETGQQRLVPLMAIAKSNEADMLGAFNADEAQQFKQMLKRAIAWTA